MFPNKPRRRQIDLLPKGASASSGRMGSWPVMISPISDAFWIVFISPDSPGDAFHLGAGRPGNISPYTSSGTVELGVCNDSPATKPRGGPVVPLHPHVLVWRNPNPSVSPCPEIRRSSLSRSLSRTITRVPWIKSRVDMSFLSRAENKDLFTNELLTAQL